jgi:hypothetical protein
VVMANSEAATAGPRPRSTWSKHADEMILRPTKNKRPGSL